MDHNTGAGWIPGGKFTGMGSQTKINLLVAITSLVCALKKLFIKR